ncbi:MAG: DUF5689 domain-containing protein [Saprospiraceae bacterium]
MKQISFLSHNLITMFKGKLHSLPFTFLLLVTLISISPMACVDLDFDTPPAGGSDPNLPVTTTIAELKARHVLGKYEQITDDITLAAIVISDDATGNFYKQLEIQDATGGIELRIEMTNIRNLYPVGRKVYIKAKGLWLGDYNGLTQLGAGVDVPNNQLIRIPQSLLGQFIISATYGNSVIPKTKAINELTLADVSTLIKLDGVQFVSADAGQTYADAVLQQSVNRNVEDCARRMLTVRSSGFASFAGDKTPTGGGSIVGVLGIFGSTYQLTIRDLNDVSMTGERCTVVIDESFTSLANNANVMLPEWSNIAVKGTRLWQAKVFNGDMNHYAQATSFGDTSPEMESWLITPAITTNIPKKITFETAKSFYVQDGLSVWISSNFNGADVTGATWTQLFPTLAGAAAADNTFIPSGDIDLSGYTGSVRIGFKYVGSGPGGQTGTFRVDNVKVTNL